MTIMKTSLIMLIIKNIIKIKIYKKEIYPIKNIQFGIYTLEDLKWNAFQAFY